MVGLWIILPPVKFPSLPSSHTPVLPRSIHPPLASSLPSFPRAVHAPFRPFLARSLHQPSLPQPSLPPLTLSPCITSSLPPCLSPSLHPLPPSFPPSPIPPSLPPTLLFLPPSHPPSFLAPTMPPPCLTVYRRPILCRPTPCVCVCVGELHWLLFRESPAMNGAETMAWSRHQQAARGYLGNAPPPRIRFWRIVKNPR